MLSTLSASFVQTIFWFLDFIAHACLLIHPSICLSSLSPDSRSLCSSLLWFVASLPFLTSCLPVSWIRHSLASSLSRCLTFLLPHCLVTWPRHQLSMCLNSSLFHSIRLIPSFILTNSTLPYLPPSESFPLHFFLIIFPYSLILPPFFPSL